MNYVLDASVAVAALRSNEPGHEKALRRCMPLFSGKDRIIVPAIFDIEVVSALLRRGAKPASIARFFDEHFKSRQLVTIGPRAVRAVLVVAELTRLRAADALYVWLAARENLTLVTADSEVTNRAPLAGVHVTTP